MFTDNSIFLDLLWLEYQDAAEDAQAALSAGNKLQALALAIIAYKIKSRYEGELSKILLKTN